MKILIMGIGAIGHTFVSSCKGNITIDILTSNDVEISQIKDTYGNSNKINQVLTYDTIKSIDYDYLIVTLPFRYKINRLNAIADIISPTTTIVVAPANQGMYEYMPKHLRETNPLIMLERVPFISRVVTPFEEVKLFGHRKDMHMAILNGANLNNFLEVYPHFGTPKVHNHQLDISLISSNTTLHTCRIYNYYKNNTGYATEFLFYEDFTDADAELFVNLENEVLAIKDAIEAQTNLRLDLYDMYRHFNIKFSDVNDAKLKISQFDAFQKITFKVNNQAELLENRYFVDDCILGTNYFIKLGDKYNVATPYLSMINTWALSLYNKELPELKGLDI